MNTFNPLIAAILSAVSLTAQADVRTERVTFTSGGETLVGTLYIPDGVDAKNPAAAAVVTGAWMTIKEQMPARYGRELAERGVVALTFDFRNWGESGGKQRALESPALKTEDIRAAVVFLQTRKEVDDSRLSGLGICASAGYMAQAAATTPALRRVALVAPWLHDGAIVEQVYGGKESLAKLIATSRDAQARYTESGELSLVPAASKTDKTAVMFDVPYYTEADRGLIAKWANQFNLASWEPWLTFEAMPAAPKLTQPLLIVHSEAAAIPHGAKQFYAAVPGEKQSLWLDGISQFDFYDRDNAVDPAADAVAKHFN